MREIVDDWVCERCGQKVDTLEHTGRKCPKCGCGLTKRMVVR